ncbi:alpha/beta fold hydrolase [Streptomyces sp. NPDC003720]|uniref:alpha/beta hydrolase family protein n=1 Tax=Streptomyces sp. NPDC003720 TaxID=3364684 RepID=UPI0036C2E624
MGTAGDVWRIPLSGRAGDGPAGGPCVAALVTVPRTAPRAVVLLWPALAVTASYYAPFAGELAARGIAVVVADLRGQGHSRPRAGRATRYGYHELAVRDWPVVVGAVRERFGGEVPLFLLGHSFGGQVSALYAAREPKGVDGLVTVAAGSVDHRGFSGAARLRVLAGTQFISVISALWGYWPGHRLGFGGRQPARLMRDWARISRTGRFRPSGADFDYEAAFGGVTLPVLAVSVAGDRLAPPSAVDRLCAKLSSAEVERWHYQPPAGDRSDHVRWARSGADIAARISDWVHDRATSGDK